MKVSAWRETKHGGMHLELSVQPSLVKWLQHQQLYIHIYTNLETGRGISKVTLNEWQWGNHLKLLESSSKKSRPENTSGAASSPGEISSDILFSINRRLGVERSLRLIVAKFEHFRQKDVVKSWSWGLRGTDFGDDGGSQAFYLSISFYHSVYPSSLLVHSFSYLNTQYSAPLPPIPTPTSFFPHL